MAIRERMSGNEAIATAMKQVNPDVMGAFPITPSTEIPEYFSQFMADGEVDTQFVPVESEHSAMSVCIGASAAGARAVTATSSCGLAFMWELLYVAASSRLPITMVVSNRALTGPINIGNDHSDSMGARDSGWIQLYAENNQEAYDAALEAWQDAHSGEEESSASGEEAEAAADGTAQTQETAGTAASVEAAQADGQDTAAVGGSGADPSADKFDWDFDNYPTTDYVLNSIWRNDMISTSYEPGSTGKVITYAAALEENAVTEDTPFSDPGSIQVGSTVINCHNKDLGGCGDINAEIGLENSCNVAFVGIGQALGVHNFVKYQKMFNFGQLTGVDLPGEVNCAGLLFPEDQMTDLDLATNAFGQCYNVTMLQMATAFSAAINGGTYYRPYVVSAILNADGTTAQTIEPEPVRQVISEETSRRVREALSLVVYGESGTGGRMPYADGKYLSGYHFIAKTGTAQKLPRADKKYLISVISAVPEDSPQLVLYVTIDEYGGELQADSYPAQQLSGEIWGAVLDYIGVYSDDAADVDRYRYDTTGAAASDEEWNDGTLSMENLEGGPLGTPEPPADDGSGEDTSSLLISPDEILNPDSALPDPESAG